MNEIVRYKDVLLAYILQHGMRVVGAILILVIGLWLIKRINKFIFELMVKRGVDESLRPFIRNVLGIAMRVLLVIVVISQIGVEATSFIAILGSAGLAVGLALQGSLSNFAGGVLILTLKPFRVGDFIEAQSQAGTVKLINIFNTVLKTADNKTIIIPNGPLANSTVVNYSMEPQRRVDLKFIIGYRNDIAEAKEIINRILDEDERVLAEPARQIISEVGENNITIMARVWVNSGDYWPLYWYMQEKVKFDFEKAGIERPATVREQVSLK
ncbi:MAG: mechanosensitive ion channel [Hymenobacteraceae bacterium]|nr:mechanosensitive ion channel [Hymenobacteraceae bacterium]MDX5394906.1 mechanosensitive ion channel [Hymenobacteraceae bacterium]MDX5444171.1 mechanosensitive ion channel [Hymenobacteraceae bacterium]MDX5510941.1 mechanosensitive ion channel [Hymenobacteraceae bacterium]